jgi:hypothetical protein
VADVAAADGAIRQHHFAYVSPGPVTTDPARPQGALLVRDPDGHATLLESDGPSGVPPRARAR